MPLEAGDPTERVAVLRTDLEQWQVVLRWIHGLASSIDLQSNYMAGRPEMKRSKLTNLSAQAHNRIEGYLDNGESDELISTE